MKSCELYLKVKSEVPFSKRFHIIHEIKLYLDGNYTADSMHHVTLTLCSIGQTSIYTVNTVGQSKGYTVNLTVSVY